MGTAPGRSSDIRAFIFAALVVCAIAFGFQGSRALWAPDEGIFGEVAKEMVDSGDWLIPTLHHQPYPEKPPLMYWCMAAGMKILGRNEWGLRLFFGFSLVFTALLTGLLGAELWGRREGLLAGLFYGTMLVPVIAANISRPDALLVAASTAAMYCFWKSIRSAGVPPANGTDVAGKMPALHVLWKMLMCAAFGIGFLAKGPAVLVIAAPMFYYLFLTGRVLKYFLTPWALLGVLVFAATGLGWYALFISKVPGSGAYFWDNEVWGRLFTNKYRRHQSFIEGITVYGPTLLGGSLPWAVLWPYWIVRAKAPIFTADWWKNLRQRPEALLVLLWVVVPVVVFGLAKSKLHLYVLPVFPAIALASARAWVRYPLRPNAGDYFLPRGAIALLVAWAALLITAKYVSANGELLARLHISNERDEREMAAAIVSQLPPDCQKVAVVNEELNGMGFYMQQEVFDATLHGDPYPTFIQAPKLSDVLREAAKAHAQMAVVCRSKKAMLDLVEAVYTAQGIAFTKQALPFKHTLILLDEAADPRAPAPRVDNGNPH